MTDCVFCGIVNGDIDADLVCEGDAWLAFRDLQPKAPTHVLVVPRRHVASVDALSEKDAELAGALFSACGEVAAAEGLEGGYRVVTNVGEDGGQSVAHLHLHILGGRRMGWPPG